MATKKITLKNVRVHNLKGVDLSLEIGQLIVFTGVSGSGKSSLAFDTIYAEGQRRYIESLSTFARRHLGDFPKPEAEAIDGISPTIAIEQKTSGRNPRSTVGTMTGIYDFLRVLYARVGTPHCPISGEAVAPQSSEQIMAKVQSYPKESKLIILAPYAKEKKAEFKEDFADLLRRGFTRVRLDGKIIELGETLALDGSVAHDVDLVIDRLQGGPEHATRIAEAVKQALEIGGGVMSVLETEEAQETLFSTHAFAKRSGLSYPPLEPHDFSFNHPSGMCPSCQGLGFVQEFDLNLIIDENKSIQKDCCLIAGSYQTVRWGNIYNNLARLYQFKVTTPWKNLSNEAKRIFLYGNDKKWTPMQFRHPTKNHTWTEYVGWKGVIHDARQRFEGAKSEFYKEKMQALMQKGICPSCQGQRIKPYPAATLLQKKRIANVTSLPISEALHFFEKLKLTKTEQKIAGELLKEIVQRLRFLQGVGLHYMSLERTSPTLSGGEAQRVRLASQVGTGLVGTTYVLDEPSIGLHPRDNEQLIKTLKTLRDLGNTVIVVEHDEETIRSADEIVDFGPGAGSEGGEVVAQGDIRQVMQCKRSLTGGYLSGRLNIAIPSKRRKFEQHLTIRKATHHNLQEIDVEIPLGILTAVTGVSGSGKSSLIRDILYPALANRLHNGKLPVGRHLNIEGMEQLDKVIAVDQTPIGRTPRSNPATYVKLFDDIRDLFATLPESAALGFTSSRFSFNLKEGSCPHCAGMGMTKIDMDFLEDEWIPCLHCKGQRFDEKTLSIRYKGKTIHDILEMTISEAGDFFSSIPHLYRKISTLLDVGLGYMRLGQPSPSVSGGEAQRIKLAKELSRPATGKTLYILDEPTTGLHFHDVHKLIQVLYSLVEKGNTVVVIEHNMDLVKTADWVLDMGPEGGKEGGRLIASGTPEQIVEQATPTGNALRAVIEPQKNSKALSQPPKKRAAPLQNLTVEGAFQNNLKGVSAVIPRDKITLCTGPSGSGKSSFAFETIYAEGQRRYVESMSLYARQFIKQSPKPKVEQIEGLSPAIAIEQKHHAGNPRSTVGTLTEIYDYLRILYAHLGEAYCPETGFKIETISREFVAKRLLELPDRTKLQILSPLILKKQESFVELKERLQSQGFLRIRLNGQYRELDEEIEFDQQRKNEILLVIDRIVVQTETSSATRSRLLEAIEQASQFSNGQLIADANGQDLFFNLSFAVPQTGKSYSPITPHTFSFNTAQGMCPDCTGLGFQWGADLASHPEIQRLSPADLIEMLWQDFTSSPALKFIVSMWKKAGIAPQVPLKQQPAEALKLLFHGIKDEMKWKGLSLRFKGINQVLAQMAKSGDHQLRELLRPLLQEVPCLSCQGSRLNPLARHVRLQDLTLPALVALPIEEAAQFLSKLQLSTEQKKLLEEPLRQLQSRLSFLQEIGVGYLSLDRRAPTLSGGEMQRISLARQLGSGLTGCLYVLDEPTIGLHPHNNALLGKALLKLKEMGNTLLLVEHDPLTVQLADYLLDFGPKAGKQGGEIIARGTLQEIMQDPRSLTGSYLSGKKTIPLPEKRRTAKSQLTIRSACMHNLQNLEVSFPIGAITCITGVSGSGKSTLMNGILRPAAQTFLGRPQAEFEGAQIIGLDAFDKVLVLEQNPIGHTIRADVSTYTDLLTPLRTFYASLPAARAKGLQPKNFSFNHKKGMCTTCQGLGTRTISLQFLPPVKVQCEACQGFRLNPISLQIQSKLKHLGQLLQLTVEEAREFVPAIPKVLRILDTLIEVGLGYLQLGQEIATLSGGEAQRLRLARELAKRSTGKTLYLLDEPTTGLHSEDIVLLLKVFHTLADRGNTLIIIEHNLDICASADYLIDLGPDAGIHGGKLIAAGTPEQVAKSPHSRTAPYLRDHLCSSSLQR